jgi:hypothetical protein
MNGWIDRHTDRRTEGRTIGHTDNEDVSTQKLLEVLRLILALEKEGLHKTVVAYCSCCSHLLNIRS